MKHPIKEPYKLARLLSKTSTKALSQSIILNTKEQSLIDKALLFIRGNFFIPDARKAWVKPSIAFLSRYLQEQHIDTLITTGPPHSLHLIGLELKKRLEIKWFADFRDPWTTIGYHNQLKLTKASKEKHKRLEKEVLNTADRIIVTSNTTKFAFQKLTQRPISVITNGYDTLSNVHFERDSKFTLVHIGSLLSRRNPEMLWRVIAALVAENDSFSKAFQLNLIGTVSRDVLDTIKAFNIHRYLKITGHIPHQDVFRHQKMAQLLLLIEDNSKEAKCIIPAKLFEYLTAGRPIVAVGPRESDVQKIIEQTHAGSYFHYDDDAALKTKLLYYYKQFQNEALEVRPIGLQKYSMKSLTALLVKLIHNEFKIS